MVTVRPLWRIPSEIRGTFLENLRRYFGATLAQPGSGDQPKTGYIIRMPFELKRVMSMV